MKSALTASEAKIQRLLKVNCHLSEELRLMQSKVGRFLCNCLGGKNVKDSSQFYFLHSITFLR